MQISKKKKIRKQNKPEKDPKIPMETEGPPTAILESKVKAGSPRGGHSYYRAGTSTLVLALK